MTVVRLSYLAFLLLSWTGVRATAEIPLACHPPQLALLTPPVYPAEYAAIAARQAFSAAVICDAEGTIVRIDDSRLPENIVSAVDASLRASVFRPAQTWEAPTAGFHRALFRAYFTPVAGSPTPAPQLHFDQGARDKLDSIARPIVQGWLRIRLTVNDRGEIAAIDTQNRSLDGILRTFFDTDIDRSAPPFRPAEIDGQPVGGHIDLFWDLTPPQDRRDYLEVAPELVRIGANPLPEELELPAEDLEFRAWVFPHRSNRTIGAFLDDHVSGELASLVLEKAKGWFIPDRNVGSPLEVAFRFDATERLLIVNSFRPIEVAGPSLKFSARPLYPHRRFLPDPTGFVRMQMTVAPDGRPAEVEILEASSGRFRDPALEAINAWHFSPMTFDGKPIPSRVFWTIPFDPKAPQPKD